MTHRDRRGLPARWLLAAALLQTSLATLRAEESRADDRMAAIVADVRAQEAKYRDIEYIVKITTRQADRQAPDRSDNVTSIESQLRDEIATKLAAALGQKAPVTGGIDAASLDASLVATPPSGDKPVTFTANRSISSGSWR